MNVTAIPVELHSDSAADRGQVCALGSDMVYGAVLTVAGIDNFNAPVVPLQPAGITGLAAAERVKYGLVETNRVFTNPRNRGITLFQVGVISVQQVSHEIYPV